MSLRVCAVAVALFAQGGDAAYPTACSAYPSTYHGLQGDCCPNAQGVNLACCFSGALQMDAAKASKEAEKVGSEAAKETSEAKSAAAAAQTAADDAKKTQTAADAKAKEIQSEIDDLNEHATAAQKKSQEAAAQATNDATVAAKQALAAEAASAHAKKLEAEQAKIVAATSGTATKKKAAAAAAEATADKLNDIAGAATKKLNDAKKGAEVVATAAKLKQEAEEKTVHAKNEEAAEIQKAAHKIINEAEEKKATAEAMLSKIDNAQCSKHSGCKALAGYCCPTLNFGKMHLGSAKLDGASLGCCGGATELASEEPAEMAVQEEQSQPSVVGAGALLLSALAGSAVTAMVLKVAKRQDEQSASYQSM